MTHVGHRQAGSRATHAGFQPFVRYRYVVDGRTFVSTVLSAVSSPRH